MLKKGGRLLAETILQMKGIKKSFSGVKVLKNAAIEAVKGEVQILLGENGAGKSTLMKILAGAYSKDEGEIIYKGKSVQINNPKDAEKLGIAIIYQEFNLIPYLSVAENMFLGKESMGNIPGKIDFEDMYKKAQQMLDHLDVEINPKAMVADLGIAQQQMVEIAKALSVNADVIIMDEPTAALTDKEINSLFKIIHRIKEEGVTIIYISHRLEEFKMIGDRVTIMRDGETVGMVNMNETTIDDLIKLMVGREIGNKFPKIDVEKGETLLEVRNLKRKGAFENINFTLRKGEILGVSGLMGAGRTEVMRSIFGIDPIDSGEVYLEGKRVNIKSPEDAIKNKIGFVTEDRRDEGLVLSMDVKENITLCTLSKFLENPGKLNLGEEVNEANSFIDKLKIKCSDYTQKTGNLSGGNQQKIVIAKWLLADSKILILDEPTRGIDVGSKQEIYNIMNELLKSGVGIIMISSELPEILGMSDRILVMCRGEILGELDKKEANQEKIMHYATGGGKYNAK
jgi:ribose transport system ATP-binding protein